MSGNLKYEKYFVSFIDILGFNRFVEEQNFQSVEHTFNKIFDEVRCHKNLLASKFNEPPEKINVLFFIMSDSIVIAVKETEKNPLEKVIWATMTIQVALLGKNPISLSRGAISYGDFYHNQNSSIVNVFGPALNQAVGLEKSKTENGAKYPRVIIDKKTININRKYEYLVQDEDNLFYVNYFDVFINNFSFYIPEVKKHIVKILSSDEEDIVKQKYEWFKCALEKNANNSMI